MFSFYEELIEILSYMYIGLGVKYPLFLSYFNEKRVFTTDCRKVIIIFYENPFSGNRVVPCGWMDGRTDRLD